MFSIQSSKYEKNEENNCSEILKTTVKRQKIDYQQQNDNLNEEMSTMEILMSNPGYSMISKNILSLLNHENLLMCRLVSQSWKSQVDQPHFWNRKCQIKGQSKELHEDWIDLIQRVENDDDGLILEQKLSNCLMTWHKKMDLWNQHQLGIFMYTSIHALVCILV